MSQSASHTHTLPTPENVDVISVYVIGQEITYPVLLEDKKGKNIIL